MRKMYENISHLFQPYSFMQEIISCVNIFTIQYNKYSHQKLKQ